MSTVVLARKYRPKSFAQMVGQDHVVKALANALTSRRLHHAYLFTGTRGIGKTTVSRILAKSLNCTGPDGSGGITAEPCGRCQACTEIDADRYIDYIELDAASHRGIDEARDLIERAAYKPSLGRFKVFMIDEAHQLTKDAFSALLKTLEEPPDYLKFVLATTDPERMLPTVLSRCLQFNLRPMAPETIRAHLEHVFAAEQVEADDGSLRLVSRAARGSMRDALSLADQAIAHGGGRLEESVVREMLGAVDRHRAAAIVDALARRRGAELLAIVDTLRRDGASAAGTLDELASLAQQIAVEQAVPGSLPSDDPEAALARERVSALAADEAQLLYSLALHGRGELPFAPDEYAGLTMVLLRFLAFPAAAVDGVDPPRRVVQTPAAGASIAAVAAADPDDAGFAAPAGVSVRAAATAPAAGASSVASPASALPAASAALQAGSRAARTVVKPRRTSDEPPAWLDEAPPFDDDDFGNGAAAAAHATVRLDRSSGAAPRADEAAQPTALSLRADPPSSAAPALQAIERTPLGDRWAAVVERMCAAGAIAALARELATQSGLSAIDDEGGSEERWRLAVERESLRGAAVGEKLKAALAAAEGRALRLEVQAGTPTDTPARRQAEARAMRQREAEATILNDPAVRSLLAEFSTARIVPGSIKPI